MHLQYNKNKKKRFFKKIADMEVDDHVMFDNFINNFK
jgi:hypothetical protein